MGKNIQRYTITAALPYANGPVHIGHLAGVYVPADIFVRYLRRKGKEVIFICGSDEHGVPITIRAQKEGISPQEAVDKYHFMIKEHFEKFGISFDNYSRTSAEIHHKTAADFFKKLNEESTFIEKTSEQYYDEHARQFLADRYILGQCPRCSNENAYGDQCEKCGTSLSPEELIQPRSALSGYPPILKKTKHWYLPLDRYQEFLKEWILEEHKYDWKNNVYRQVKSWLDEGLKPRAVTRDLNWGIPVPLEGAEGKVLYVWFDAPIGYISSTIEWAERQGKNWEYYWKDKNTALIHFIGKDNIVFHCIIFPAMLKAYGGYILPENVPANEFLNLENKKISTSRNWAVWLHEFLEDFPGQQDALRYILTINMPENKDNNFSWKDFQTRFNSELVAIMGNFIHRSLMLSEKYYQGKTPQAGTLTKKDKEILSQIKKYLVQIGHLIENYHFRHALTTFMNLARLGNKYLSDEAPWKIHSDQPERVQSILYVSLQIAGMLSQLAEPFLPQTAEKLFRMLNLSPLPWNELEQKEIVPPGHILGQPVLLFEKIEDPAIEKQLKKLETNKSQSSPNQEVENISISTISFEDFAKTEMRIGTILRAEKVPKADRLLKLQVDIGTEVCTIVSGIAESFSPKQLIGKQVSVVTNLTPRKIRGIESKGMLLLAEKIDGSLAFLIPEKKVENGTVIR